MNNPIRHAVIVGSARIPFARSNTAYTTLGNQDMLTAAMKAVVDRFDLRGAVLGEVAAGAVIKHARDWNLAREAALGSGLDPHTPAYDVQRACGTSLTTIIQLAHRIALGEIDSAIAGGADTASDVPVVYGRRLQQIVLESARGRSLGERLKPWLRLRPRDLKPSVPGVAEARTGLTMGEHCELMAKEWRIGRAEQDEIAYTSHRKADAAWNSGFYDDLVTPFGGLTRDNNVRPDTSREKLAALKPVFDRGPGGTLTGKMMMSRVGRARERGETQGFMKVLVDAECKKILGASLLGIEADEAIHSILDVMYAGAPYTVIQNAVHIHPTVTELIPTLLADLKPLE